MRFYKNGKEITMQEAADLLGADRLQARIAEAREAYADDPQERIEWMDGFRIEMQEARA